MSERQRASTGQPRERQRDGWDGVWGRSPHGRQGVSERQRDAGQAAVELALALPIVVMVLLALVQVAVVTRDRMAMELAAREGARAAAVSANPGTAARLAAERVTTLRPLDIEVDVDATMVTVRVSYTSTTDIAIIGGALPDVELSARSSMVLEPPAP
ncbi:MAG: pilus assembly protein [Acidimicrobiia bacterium]|nr:pilus assembly protein [Acidimicrobiia bacterium]